MIKLKLSSNKTPNEIDITGAYIEIGPTQVLNTKTNLIEMEYVAYITKDGNDTLVLLKNISSIDVNGNSIEMNKGFRVNTKEWLNYIEDAFSKAKKMANSLKRKSNNTTVDKVETTETTPEDDKKELEPEKTEPSVEDEPVTEETTETETVIEETETPKENTTKDTCIATFTNSSNDMKIEIEKGITFADFFSQLFSSGKYKSMIKHDVYKFTHWSYMDDEFREYDVDTKSHDTINSDIIFKAHWKNNKRH